VAYKSSRRTPGRLQGRVGAGSAREMRWGEDLSELFGRLGRSTFRSRFRLRGRELDYLRRKGLEAVPGHAADFVEERLAPADPANDGKQTSMGRHPVFVARHATATCCRGCLAEWHAIPKEAEARRARRWRRGWSWFNASAARLRPPRLRGESPSRRATEKRSRQADGRMVASLSAESRRGGAYCRVEIVPEVVGVLDADAESQERRREVPLSRDRSPSFHS